MNRERAMEVANAVLYEGYILYPYRPSAIKNRQRWTFGILYPPSYQEVVTGTERAQMHSECLLKVTGETTLQIQLRFLHLLYREIARQAEDLLDAVPSLMMDGKLIESRDEGIERSLEFEVGPVWRKESRDGTPEIHQFPFSFPGSNEREELKDAGGNVVGEVRRTQRAIHGTVSVVTAKLQPDLVKLTIDVTNESALPGDPGDRNSALLNSLLSAHTILSVAGGEFVSLLDPPEELRGSVAQCKNIGNFPVLAGNEGECDMMLCSPIVLYDYPQIAPESAGDFFDGTEMDEMLTLRVMTLSEDERDQMRAGNDHVRSLLQRTEASAREQLARTHGTIRSMRPVDEP